MTAIPVSETIAFAYRFLFARVGAVIGIAWFPLGVVSAMSYFARARMEALDTRFQTGDMAAAGELLAIVWILFVLVSAISTMVAVPLTRMGLGMEQTGKWVHVAFGRAEWRLTWGYIRMMLAAAALTLIIGVPATVALQMLGVPLTPDGQVPPTVSPAALIVMLIVLVAMILALITLLRMMAFLPALAASGEKVSLKRSYELSKGNVGRLIVLTLAIAGPITLLTLGGEQALLGPQADETATISDAALIAFSVFTYILSILQSGLTYPGIAFAYRALVPAGEGRSV